jgi:transcription termination/antitermination protein NusG
MTARWYIIHAYSGFEGKVRDAIKIEADRLGLAPLIEQVEVPTETVPVFHLVKNTPKVTGFLGTKGKPQPVSEGEAARILNQKPDATLTKAKPRASFEIGDSVKVLEGPFASFNGLVEEIDYDRARVKVAVSIFGRPTPVELEFEQVEKQK